MPDLSFVDAMRHRVDHILDACTRCGKCVEACPMTEPAGLDRANGPMIADGILDLLAGGAGKPRTSQGPAATGRRNRMRMGRTAQRRTAGSLALSVPACPARVEAAEPCRLCAALPARST